MTKRKMTLVLWLLVFLLNIGVWLIGLYGLEVQIGTHTFGRYIGINDEETWSSLLGLVITAGATITMVVILYRNR